MTAPVSEFHFTLYYYDQAGNLLQTVPPAGADISQFGWLNNWSDSVATTKANSQTLLPYHQLTTNYRYNIFLSQLLFIRKIHDLIICLYLPLRILLLVVKFIFGELSCLMIVF